MRHLEAGDLVEVAEEQRELVVAEGARGKRHPRSLGLQRFENLRMAVALVDGRIRGEKVEIAAAVDVGHPRALGAFDDDIEGMVVVMRAVAVFEGDQGVRIERKHIRPVPWRGHPAGALRLQLPARGSPTCPMILSCCIIMHKSAASICSAVVYAGLIRFLCARSPADRRPASGWP